MTEYHILRRAYKRPSRGDFVFADTGARFADLRTAERAADTMTAHEQIEHVISRWRATVRNQLEAENAKVST